MEQPSGNVPSNITVTTFLSADELNQANNDFERGLLEFVPGGFTVLQIPRAVPEPLTILGAATATGFGAFFERKRKLSESSEKDNTKDS